MFHWRLERLEKNITQFKSLFGWQEVVLLLSIAVILIPTLFVQWMIVDDGMSIAMAEQINNSLKNWNIHGLLDALTENEGGRFRPAYWLYYWVSYLVSGYNVLGYRIIHALVIAATVYIVFIIIKLLTSSKTVALFSSFLFLFTSHNVENWFRLGPQEPLVTFYIALSIYLLLKQIESKRQFGKKQDNKVVPYKFLIITSLALAYLTKETTVALLPFASMLYFLGRCYKNKLSGNFTDNKINNYSGNIFQQYNSLFFYLKVNVLFTVATLAAALPIRLQGSYSSNYSVTLVGIISSAEKYIDGIFISYGFLPWVLIGSFILFTLHFKSKNSKLPLYYIQLAMLSGAISFFLMQLPWAYVMGRYMEPLLFFLVIVWGIEIARIVKYLQQYNKINIKIEFLYWKDKFSVRMSSIIIATSLFYLFTFTYNNIMPIYNYGYSVIKGSNNIKQLFTFVAKETNSDSTVFLNLEKGDGTIEVLVESEFHLHYLYNKRNLNIKYLEENYNNELRKGDMVLSALTGSNYFEYSESELLKNKNVHVAKKVAYTDGAFNLLPIPYKSLIRVLFLGQSLDLLKIWDYSFSNNTWTVYKLS